jgi:hypothetical protein
MNATFLLKTSSVASRGKLTVDVEQDRVVYTLDLQHIDKQLGKLVQEFVLQEPPASFFVSAFRLYPPNSSKSQAFVDLPQNVKNKLWDEIFEIKVLFLFEHQPEIVEHNIKPKLSLEKRQQRYKHHLGNLPDYELLYDKNCIRREIYLERKR